MYRVIGMEEFQVKLASFQDVQELARLASEQDFPIRLSDGTITAAVTAVKEQTQ